MIMILDAIHALQVIGLMLPFLIVSVLAAWKENHVLFMIASAVALMTGLYSPDIISGNYDTTSLGISVGLALITLSILYVGWALRLMFWEGKG